MSKAEKLPMTPNERNAYIYYCQRNGLRYWLVMERVPCGPAACGISSIALMLGLFWAVGYVPALIATAVYSFAFTWFLSSYDWAKGFAEDYPMDDEMLDLLTRNRRL